MFCGGISEPVYGQNGIHVIYYLGDITPGPVPFEEIADAVKDAALKDKVIELAVKCGEKGRLYGSVTTAEVAEAPEKQHGVKVDKRKIDIGDPIRETGIREISVWLYSGVTTPMKLDVQPIKK